MCFWIGWNPVYLKWWVEMFKYFKMKKMLRFAIIFYFYVNGNVIILIFFLTYVKNNFFLFLTNEILTFFSELDRKRRSPYLPKMYRNFKSRTQLQGTMSSIISHVQKLSKATARRRNRRTCLEKIQNRSAPKNRQRHTECNQRISQIRNWKISISNYSKTLIVQRIRKAKEWSQVGTRRYT